MSHHPERRWVVQAQDESGDWYQVGLLYDDPKIAKMRAERFGRDFKGKRKFRVVGARPDQAGES